MKRMLRSNLNQQNAYELIWIEELITLDHLLRKIIQHIGRPAIDPIIICHRRLEKENQMNITLKFCLPKVE
jgi:hypothetical protein